MLHPSRLSINESASILETLSKILPERDHKKILEALSQSEQPDSKHPSLVLLILLSCLMLICFLTFCCWRHFFGDLTLIQLWGRQNQATPEDKKDPPPSYAQVHKSRGSLTLVDHLYPPPSYRRARELSESEDHFLAGGLPELKDDYCWEIYDMNNLTDVDCTSVMYTIQEDVIAGDLETGFKQEDDTTTEESVVTNHDKPVCEEVQLTTVSKPIQTANKGK